MSALLPKISAKNCIIEKWGEMSAGQMAGGGGGGGGRGATVRDGENVPDPSFTHVQSAKIL